MGREKDSPIIQDTRLWLGKESGVQFTSLLQTSGVTLAWPYRPSAPNVFRYQNQWGLRGGCLNVFIDLALSLTVPHFPSSSASSDSCRVLLHPRSRHPDTDCFHRLGLITSPCCSFAPLFWEGTGTVSGQSLTCTG